MLKNNINHILRSYLIYSLIIYIYIYKKGAATEQHTIFLSWGSWQGCVKMMCLHTKCLLHFAFNLQIIEATAICEWVKSRCKRFLHCDTVGEMLGGTTICSIMTFSFPHLSQGEKQGSCNW
jgi:hypothetical protein